MPSLIHNPSSNSQLASFTSIQSHSNFKGPEPHGQRRSAQVLSSIKPALLTSATPVHQSAKFFNAQPRLATLNAEPRGLKQFGQGNQRPAPHSLPFEARQKEALQPLPRPRQDHLQLTPLNDKLKAGTLEALQKTESQSMQNGVPLVRNLTFGKQQRHM